MHSKHNAKYVKRNITGQCPSCRRLTQFRFHGQQLTPPELWEELGRKINLYTCDSCGTTISQRRIEYQSRIRSIDGIRHRRQLVRRYHGRDTYKWTPVRQDA